MDKNQKLYELYRIFGYDYLFYTVINFLFFTITKGISVGEVMYLVGFYSIFCFLAQIPGNYIVEKIGLKKSMMFGNLFWIVHVLLVLFGNNMFFFILGEAISSIGTTFKSLSDSQYIYKSLKQTGKKKLFAKVEGRAVSGFYTLEAISALFVGFVFEINNYIPIVCTLICMVISFIVTLFMDEMPIVRTEKPTVKRYLKDFKLVLKSSRVKSIYLYCFLISAIVTFTLTLQKDVITSLDVSPSIYGIILAIFTFCIGFGSKLQYKLEKITKRKTLTVVGYGLTLILVFVGIINSLNIAREVILVITVIVLFIDNTFQGIYRISVKKYLNNFTTSKVRGKILSIFYLFEGLGKAIIMFSTGFIVDNFGTNTTLIVVGTLATFALVFILFNMKNHVGLNPEEYSKDDIFGIENKV